MTVDCLAMLMCIIVAFVGGLICIYAVGYMKGYHKHHTEYQDRSGFFFSMLFLFLAAMFGLVLSANLVWMYFFWEVTSVISFLLIGYTRTRGGGQQQLPRSVDEPSGRPWLCHRHRGGSLARWGRVQLGDVVAMSDAIIPVGHAGVCGPDQIAHSFRSRPGCWAPWSRPRPSSALLHSATMVKAGVYLLIAAYRRRCCNTIDRA